MSYVNKQSSEEKIVNKLIGSKIHKRKEKPIQTPQTKTNSVSFSVSSNTYASPLFAKTINRNALTTSEYLSLLAKPKQVVEPVMTNNNLKQVPTKKRKIVNYNWNDYTITIPISKLYFLLKDISMFTNEEIKHFFKTLRDSEDIKIKRKVINKNQNKDTPLNSQKSSSTK
ncbi:uncharacterized protein LOC123298860 [Chrysoperla carnea]|uniref:uncharacterized protein LOC123298860 n=1 Tax=Chrysoperla carnea TaxID=189513 RepID=UPI001D0781D3|nr:uncharacterized protein LOC123298860 [Chrysoperla carnea]